MRKRQLWKAGEAVIFNDMGNWGMGVVMEEGRPSDSSRWYWIEVRESMDPLNKPRRLVRADDVIPFLEETWASVKADLMRLDTLEGERRACTARLRALFAPPDPDEL